MTEQLEVVVAPIWVKVQGEPLKVPAAPAVEVASRAKVTVPVGNEAVPASASETVAVHVLAWFNARGVVQLTEVLVERAATVRLKPAASDELAKMVVAV